MARILTDTTYGPFEGICYMIDFPDDFSQGYIQELIDEIEDQEIKSEIQAHFEKVRDGGYHCKNCNYCKDVQEKINSILNKITKGN